MTTHLMVIHSNGENNAERIWNPRRTEFRWNEDCSAFEPIELRWWDDASYIAYQCGEDHDEEYCNDGKPWSAVTQTIPIEEDNIPF